ncbi:MAG: hypothetical protein ACUVRV_01165 [Cyanobacteriota bacterium]
MKGTGLFTCEVSEDAELEAVRLILASNGTFDELIAGLNEEFALPQDIQIVFLEYGTVNTFMTQKQANRLLCNSVC